MDVTLEPGMVLGGTYRLVSVIGRGGMGEVWRASHERLPKDVAVKVLLHVPVSGDTTNARFRREAEIASRLSHPNIVEILDFNVLPEGVPYMVLELLQGVSLRDRIQEGPISLEETAELVRQIGSALAAAHALGVVHRDLKPENIFLVNETGDRSRPFIAKVLDFGISKILGDTALTMDREVLGTPYYMAPEQAAGRRDQMDGRTDQFALACIAYEMLSGTLPFSGQTIMEVLGSILNGEPEPIERLVPDLPGTVVDAIDRALAKKPDQRFPHILEFSSAFCSFLGPRLASGASWTAKTDSAPGSPPQRQDATEEKTALGSAATQMLSTDGNGEKNLDFAASQAAGPQESMELATGKTLASDSQSVVTNSGQGTGPDGPNASSQPAPVVPQTPETGGDIKPRSRLGWYLGTAGVLTVLAAAGWWFFRPKAQESQAPGARPRRIAVPRDLVSRDASDSRPRSRIEPGTGPDAGIGDHNTPRNSSARELPPRNSKKPTRRKPVRTVHRATAPRSPHKDVQSAPKTLPVDPAILKQYVDSMAEAGNALRQGNFQGALGAADRATKACAAARRAARKAGVRRQKVCSLSKAWKLYTMAACGRGVFGRAKSGFARLRGRSRRQVQAFCKKHGIVVGQK